MGFILMQPANDDTAAAALHLLQTTDDVPFDQFMDAGRLQPIRFGSRRCLDNEQHYHSFTGEVSSGRWAFNANRRFLWGAHFYWICDCNSVKPSSSTKE